jgi:hypothetical protein
MISNSGYRDRAWKAIRAVVARLPQEYVATNHTQVLGQYTQSRHPHVSLKRWLIELPTRPGTCRICATWVWKIEPGFIGFNIGGLPRVFNWGSAAAHFRGWKCYILQGTTYDAVMGAFDVHLTTMMHQDPLFNDQRFVTQVIETFSARFVVTHTSIQSSIDTLINIIIAASECNPSVHNLTMNYLRKTLLQNNVWLSELQMQRILDEGPRAIALRRLCSAQVRHRTLSNNNNRPRQNFLGGLPFHCTPCTLCQQLMSSDPRIYGPPNTPFYLNEWFHVAG